MKFSKRNAEGYSDPTAYEALIAVARERNKRQYRPLVFICSPFAGDVMLNTENARQYSRFAVRNGVIPIAPHLLFPQFMDDSNEEQRKLGISFGLALMNRCSEVWVFGKEYSHGMKLEITQANKRHMLIRYFDEQCRETRCNDIN